MVEMRDSGLSFYDAAKGKRGCRGKPMDPVRQFMVRSWLDEMERVLRNRYFGVAAMTREGHDDDGRQEMSSQNRYAGVQQAVKEWKRRHGERGLIRKAF